MPPEERDDPLCEEVGFGGATLGRGALARAVEGTVAFLGVVLGDAPDAWFELLASVVCRSVFPFSTEGFGGLPLFTKLCCLASYTIEESRLKVTARLPERLERMVRETLVGGAAGRVREALNT